MNTGNQGVISYYADDVIEGASNLETQQGTNRARGGQDDALVYNPADVVPAFGDARAGQGSGDTQVVVESYYVDEVEESG